MPQLIAASNPVLTTNLRFFAIPTPGKANGAGTSELGPMVTDVSVPVVQPGDSDNIVVTAAVRKTITNVDTDTVTLHYRVMYNSRSKPCRCTTTGHTATARPPTESTARRFRLRPRRRGRWSAGT